MSKYSPLHLLLASQIFLACRTDKTITTVNASPKIVIVSHQTGDRVLEGYFIDVRAQVSDSNNSSDELEVAWYYGEDKICDWSAPDTGGATSCTIVASLDANTVRAEARDPDGAGAVESITLDIVPTEAPTAEISLPLPSNTYYADQKVTLEGTALDAEDDPDQLVVEWYSDIDGLLVTTSDINSNGDTQSAVYLTEGEHFIEMLVTDQTGKTDSDSVTILVGPSNSAPSCSILSPANASSIIFGETVLFEAMVADADIDADDLHVAWSSDKDGPLGSSIPNSDGSVNFAYADLSVNTHTITMVVTDELDESCTASRLIQVGSPPSITISSPLNGDIFNEGDPIFFQVGVTDGEDQANQLQLAWFIDGQPISTQSATSSGIAQFSSSNIPYGSHNLVVEVTDTDGFNNSAQVFFTVNALPTEPVISITPNLPTTAQALTVTIVQDSVDPDSGNTPSYTYQWYKNNVLQAGLTNPSISASLTSKNDNWSVRVTPNDGMANGPYAQTNTTIQNTPPTLQNISISPSTASNTDTLTCSATITDPDETVTPSFTWTVDGQTYSGNSLDLSTTSAMPFSVVTCALSATDGDSPAITGSTSITVQNNPPVVQNVHITPSPLFSTSTATCGYSSTDTDGDSLTTTVTWYNGSNTIGTGDTIALFGIATRGDSITCSVTSSDGTSSTTVQSPAIIVSNTAPTAPVVTVTSTNAPDTPVELIDDLLCTVQASDIDGDSLTYSYTWRDPQNSITRVAQSSNNTDTLPAVTPTYPGDWTCSVSVTDGSLLGGIDSDSIYVETGCIYGEYDCPGTSCQDILNNAGSQGDGIYWINPDGNGLFDVYCDMGNGGWTLLLSADGNSTYWGNNSPNWWANGADTAPMNMGNFDTHSPAYGRLDSNQIKLCLGDSNTCHIFNHQYNMSLQDFFTTNTSYTEYSYQSVGYSNVGNSSSISQFETELGHSVAVYSCQWLGINDVQSISAIGFLADGNGGCSHLSGSYRYHDDTAFGVGLQSCVDANSCNNGGSGHLAGQTRAVDGADAVLGPWFVFAQ